jgi:hypothetical protein
MTQASEYRIHCAIVELIELTVAPGVIWYHPASGEHRSAITGARLKRMGVRRGVPDLAFVLADGRAAFLEIKTAKGRLTPEQAAFRDACLRGAVPWDIARSVEDAHRILSAWGAIGISSHGRRGRVLRAPAGGDQPITALEQEREGDRPWQSR